MSEKFSDRIGATQPRKQLQLRSVDAALRNALWNWVGWALQKEDTSRATSTYTFWERAANGGLWDEVFHLPVDEIPADYKIPGAVKRWFMDCQWYEAYNFIEYLLQNLRYFRPESKKAAEAAKTLNYFLEREMSGYRVVQNRLVEITSDVEIREVERAATPTVGYEGVARHVDTALALLGQKPEPDYRNSIKESISAVEATVKLLTGEKSGGIDTALKLLEKRGRLHPAFKAALSKLYGYTSDEEGIRHPILDEANVSFAEAKFMLVVCSAFANLLIESSVG